MKRKLIKRIVIITSIVLVVSLLIGAYFISGNYIFKYMMVSDQSTSSVSRTIGNQNKFNVNIDDWPKEENHRSWLLYESGSSLIEIESSDGNKLRAIKTMSEIETNKWIIIVHGWRSSATSMHSYIYHFHELGYNTLAIDLESLGMSEGKYIGMGYSDRFDVLKWIDEVIAMDNNAEIALFGVSMGAATVLMTSGEELKPNVKAVIEDCGYSSVEEEIKYLIKKVTGLPYFIGSIAVSSTNIYSKSKTGESIYDMNTVEQLKKSKTPTLFIHGDQDDFVPFEMLDILYNANDNIEKEKLVIEGALHAYSATQNPELYYSTINNFLNRYFS